MPCSPTPASPRVALVTGGSRGIGAAVSLELAERGLSVAVNFVRQAERATEVAGRCGASASAWQADVSDAGACEAMLAGVLERYGRLDVLVLNAGIWRGGRIESLAAGDWRSVLDATLNGAFNLCRLVVPVMRRQRYGRIVAVSSVIGMIGHAGDGAYATAKAGIIGLVRSLAKEVAHDGVTVNAVAPGLIDTDMTAGIPARARDRLIERTALARPGCPEDVAHAVAYLALHGDYVTGQVLVVDGGLSL